MDAKKTLHPEGPSGLLRAVIVIGSLAAVFAMGWHLTLRSWYLSLIYALLVWVGARSVLGWSRKKTVGSETPTGRDQRIIGIALLAAVLVQFSLKVYVEFSWLWSIVIALAVLFAILLLARGSRAVGESFLKMEPTWLFGNLPPLDLKYAGRAGGQPSGRYARSMPQLLRDNLVVGINGQAFSLGDRFETDRLALANFEECGSVALVRARALPDQVVLATKRCVARSFGGEFTVATIAKENTPPSTMIVSTAFLYYGKGNPLEPLRLQRIAIVAAGGEMWLDAVTQRFAKLASEMLGESLLGSGGQRIWDASGTYMVLKEEEWKGLHRTTIIWTGENLDIGGPR
jgi:hypothetical protein